MKKVIIYLFLGITISVIAFVSTEIMNQKLKDDTDKVNTVSEQKQSSNEIVNNTTSKNENKKSDDTIELKDKDGKKKNYVLKYNDMTFIVIYTTDNWKIKDSYKITNKEDMIEICKLLIEEHPIHGRDKVSYRTAEDMAHEWQQHNLAYMVIPEDSRWKENAKDVDLNPEDQGKSLSEMYEDRAGKKLNVETVVEEYRK